MVHAVGSRGAERAVEVQRPQVLGCGTGGPLISQGKPAAASASHPTSPPSLAVDGDLNTAWNAGGYASQWIEVDLGREQEVSGVRLTMAQLPAGRTVHEVQVSGEGKEYRTVHTFDGVTDRGVTLAQDFCPALTGVRYVRVMTTVSPSWIAWFEVQVYGPAPVLLLMVCASALSVAAAVPVTPVK